MFARLQPQARAATLVEILTVLGTLSILLFFSLPRYQNTLSFARQIQCGGNLRQWGLATQLYAVENDDFLPKDGAPNGRSFQSGWYISLPRQLGIEAYHRTSWHTNSLIALPRSLWICPANRRRSNGHNLFHYCLNQHINGAGAGNQVKLSNLKAQNRLIWLFDNGGKAAVAQHNNVHTNLHRKGANFLFLDGHVSRKESHQYWNYVDDRGRTTVPSLQWKPD